MTPGDPADRRDSRSGPEPTEEWLEQLAQSEGVTREDILKQLVSSYWTLKEMHGLIEQGEEGGVEEWPLDVESLYSDSFAEELEDVTERLERLENGDGGEDTVALRAEVEMLAERIDGVEGSLRDRLIDVEERVDEEFGNLERILDYLIDTTDDVERDLKMLSKEQEADRRRRAEQERLTELKHLASRLGVRKAKCEYCGANVDIALLPTPECPQCDRQFTDLDPDKGWFGLGSSTLKVTDKPYIDGAGRDDEQGHADGGQDGSNEVDAGFVWDGNLG